MGAGAGVLCRASTKKEGGDDKKKQNFWTFIPSPIGDLKPRVEQHFTATFLRSAFGICELQAPGCALHLWQTGWIRLASNTHRSHIPDSRVAVKLSLNSWVSMVVEALPSAFCFVDAGLHFSALTGLFGREALLWNDWMLLDLKMVVQRMGFY